MAFPISPSPGTTHITGHGSTYTYNAKGAWDLTTIGARYIPPTFTGSSLSMTPASLNAQVVGTAVSVTFSASGGTSPYTYALSGGALPAGLSLSSGGALTGTPTTAGNYAFSVTATDTANHTVTNNYSVTVAATNIAVSPSSMPSMQVGVEFSVTMTATGGAGSPYTFSISVGALPAGLSLNATTGKIIGTPSASGSYGFTVTATDGASKFGSRAYGGSVAGPTIIVTPDKLPTAMVNRNISLVFAASGGNAPYTWYYSAVQTPVQPPGVNLYSNGLFQGVPTAAGTYSMRIMAQDADGNVGYHDYSFVVAAETSSVDFVASSGSPRDSAYENGSFFFDSNRSILYHKRGGRWYSCSDPANAAPDYYPFTNVVGGFAVVYEQAGNPDNISGGIGTTGDFYHDLATNKLHLRYNNRWSDYVYQLDASLPPGITRLLAWGNSEQPNVSCKYWIDTRYRVIRQWAYGTTWQRFPAGATGTTFYPLTTIIDFLGDGTPAGVDVRLPPSTVADADNWSAGRGWFALDRNAANGPRLFQWDRSAPSNWKMVNDWKGQSW